MEDIEICNLNASVNFFEHWVMEKMMFKCRTEIAIYDVSIYRVSNIIRIDMKPIVLLGDSHASKLESG